MDYYPVADTLCCRILLFSPSFFLQKKGASCYRSRSSACGHSLSVFVFASFFSYVYGMYCILAYLYDAVCYTGIINRSLLSLLCVSLLAGLSSDHHGLSIVGASVLGIDTPELGP